MTGPKRDGTLAIVKVLLSLLKIGLFFCALAIAAAITVFLYFSFQVENDTDVRLERFIQDVGPDVVRGWAKEQIADYKKSPESKREDRRYDCRRPDWFGRLSEFTSAELLYCEVCRPQEGEQPYLFLAFPGPVGDRYIVVIAEDEAAIPKWVKGYAPQRARKLFDGIWYHYGGSR